MSCTNAIKERITDTARRLVAAELAAGRAALTEMKQAAADKLERGDDDEE